MDKKIYYVSPLTWMITLPFQLLTAFILFCCILVVPSILTIENPFSMLFIFLVIIFLASFVLYAALIFSDIPTTRLELSDEGLTFYGNGYRIYTPWENIAEVGWLPRYRSFPSLIRLKEPAVVGEISFEEGIASRRAVSEKRRWWMLTRQIKAEAQYTKYIRIPVALLRRKDKQDGSISHYLQYYMPYMIDIRK